uniref:Protein phosphatase inhibitor 2-like n=1 Tax=Prolemur simus TaxID=1328070 RepID=A0A8C9A455_PROSS
MEQPEALGAAGRLNQKSPGETTRGVPGGVRGVEAGAGQPSGTVLFHDSGVPLHSGSTIVRSSGSSWPSGGGPSQISVFEAYSTGSGGPGVNSSGCSLQSGSTCLHPNTSQEDRPRSILKKNSSISMQKPPTAEKEKKSQRWDEMNILATYHPPDKDYGFMKVDEPSTPYHRLEDSFEDLTAGSSHMVTPEALAEKFATMDDFCPKVLQYGDNRSSGSPNNVPRKYSSDFHKRRKAHYDEGKFLKAQKNQPLDDDEDSNGGSVSISSGSQGVMLNPEPRPVQRGWAGGLAKEVKDETDLVTRSSSDSSTNRSQSSLVLPIIALEQEISLQRREYYSKGRYLRSCSHPELEEDSEDEQQDNLMPDVKNSLTQTLLSPDETLWLQLTQKEETEQWEM